MPASAAHVQSLENRLLFATYVVSTDADSGAGSLRQAITSANAHAGKDTISFTILGMEQSIRPVSPLPQITGAVMMDGHGPVDEFGNPTSVWIQGEQAGESDGLVFSAPGNTVKGLVFGFFSGVGMRFTAGSNVIQNNIINTSGEDGMQISGANNIIGGANAGEGNDFTVERQASGFALSILPGGGGDVIYGNHFTSFNASGAVLIQSSNETIGGIATGQANRIGGFIGPCILVSGSVSGCSIRGNQIHSFDVAQRIDLSATGTTVGDGPTANDTLDADTGPNELQNAPVLTDVRGGSTLTITGALNSKPSQTYHIDFYSDNNFVGTTDVITDSSGNANFTGVFTPSPLTPSGVTITALATDSKGNTSEFSSPRATSYASLQNGVLTVLGNDAAERFYIHGDDTTLLIDRGKKQKHFPLDQLKRIEAFGFAGADSINIDSSTPGKLLIPCYMDGGEGDDYLYGGNGNDTLTGGAGQNSLYGYDGDDRLNGSGSRDSLLGGAGNDRLYGNGGDDTLDGGGGVDRAFGGDGNDSILGGSSNDKLYGQAGDDTLKGQGQSDILDGGDGNDTAIKDDLDVLVDIEVR